MSKISLRFLRKTKLMGLYKALLTNEEITLNDRERLLKVAVILLNSNDLDLERFGYRVVLLYANKFSDYEPLYDLSVNFGYTPIVNLINLRNQKSVSESESFWSIWNESLNENFRYKDKYLTSGQFELHKAYSQNNNSDISVVAPTSYGKSDLMLTEVVDEKGNVCVLLPTKALLAQTKKRVLNSLSSESRRKIITHPEMYTANEKGVIAIFTQERLFRLLQMEPKLKFDLVVVDEAHNLLENDERSRLLASTLIFLKSRNKSLRIRFLTPFLVNTSNLELGLVDYTTAPILVTENIKTEKIFCFDPTTSDGLEIYDQYLDEFIQIDHNANKNELDFIFAEMGPKNIIYLNKPKNVEDMAKRFSRKCSLVKSEGVERATRALEDYLHKDYYLINCLKHGICYHHGSVPDIIKLYIEHLYKKEDSLHTIVTNSTLLEGVNIPADTLFILDAKKGRSGLSAAQFKNLIGRVCRFSEIFDPSKGRLQLLEPRIFVIASSYFDNRMTLKKFISNRLAVGKKVKDELENVLLKNTKITDENETDKAAAIEFIANVESGAVDLINVRISKTVFGKLCFTHSVNEINILDVEEECQGIVDELKQTSVVAESADDIISMIEVVFLPFASTYELQKLRNEGAMDFYSMFIGMRMRNTSLGQMIANFMSFWKQVEKVRPLIYVGNKWGDVKKEGHNVATLTNIREKSEVDRINLAIVRIKEEQDYFENTIMKLVEVLNAAELVSQNTYLELKYGTTDLEKIALIKSGISSGLASLLITKYRSNIKIDIDTGAIEVDQKVHTLFRKNKENDLAIFELGLNFRMIEEN